MQECRKEIGYGLGSCSNSRPALWWRTGQKGEKKNKIQGNKKGRLREYEITRCSHSLTQGPGDPVLGDPGLDNPAPWNLGTQGVETQGTQELTELTGF